MLRLLMLPALAAAVELTESNWSEKTAGKSVFVKFLAPWCGHCKSMKPAWDKLMKEYENHPSALVADVDCTAAGQSLCTKQNVRGYPTIKWGDPAKLQDYQGGRDFNALKAHADANLGPKCNMDNIDLCEPDVKEMYAKYKDSELEPLEGDIKEKRKSIKAIEAELGVMREYTRKLRKEAREKKAAEKKAEKEAAKAKKEL